MSELDKCPHKWCYTEWHGLAITRRLWEMRQRGVMDPEYRYRDDDSDVLCPGSLFVGEFSPPMTPQPKPIYIEVDIRAMLHQHLARINNVWTLPDIDQLTWGDYFEDIELGYTQ